MEETARRVGALIGSVLDDHAEANPESPRVGFCLMMFTFGEGGWATYLSNAEREDMVEAIRELLGNIENGG
jgi:hypothetical protein